MEERSHFHKIEWDNEKASALWDYYSVRLRPEQYFSQHSGYFILREIGNTIDLGRNVLDFGCGPGFLIAHLLRQVREGKVFGIDFSPKAVSATNSKFEKFPSFGGAVQVKEFPSSFDSSSMDVIVSVELIEHLNDEQMKEMLTEAYRLLKTGGKLVLTTPNKEDLEENEAVCPECGCIFHRWQHVKSWDAGILGECLEANHFKPMTVRPCHFQSRKARFMNHCTAFGKRLLGRRAPLPNPHLLAIAQKNA
jgi:cyclopropane fatty-acyl-phospholipid synthase-like methyltransferase